MLSLVEAMASLSIIELGYSPATDENEGTGNFNKTAIGFWRYTAKFDDIDGLGGRGKSQGAYMLSEQSLFHETGSKIQGLAGFARFGVASENVNVLDWSASLGARYRGLISGRDDDLIDLAINISHASKDYRNTGNFKCQETGLELIYRAKVKSWLAIQLTIQGIINPSLDSNIKDAWAVGTRVELEL